MSKSKDLSNIKFNKLLVLNKACIQNGKAYWNCICDCGNRHITYTSNLTTGKTQSCGCIRKIKASIRMREYSTGRIPVNKLRPFEAAFNILEHRYKKGARERNIKFKLTKNQLKKISQLNCYYCGSKPKQKIQSHESTGILYYNGIDRIDSNKGYTIANSVPCCGRCNRAKWNFTT